MRSFITTAAIALSLSFSAVASAESSPWKLAAKTMSTAFTVPAQSGSSHEFGMLKYTNACAKDEFYLTWTSNSSAVWSLAGKRVNVQANFDGINVDMPLEVVSIRKVNDKHQVEFAHLKANKQVVGLLDRADSVTLTMPGNTSQYFTTSQERFSLKGFMAARDEATERCDHMSNNYMARAN